MKILQLHTDFIEFRLIKKEIDAAEDCELKEFKYDNILVLFTSVEEGDDENVVLKAVEDVKNSLNQFGVNKILIYPFAHLSSNLANPFEAYKVLKFMEESAKGAGIETYRAPFGWNKQFTLSIKGHPLAEQFRSISREDALEEKVPQALKAEEKIKSYWYIITVEGELVPVERFDFRGHENLEKFARYEMAKVRAVKGTPPHVTLMQRLEIADYEPASDQGNLRWYPKGRLIKSLIEEFVTSKVIEYGAMEVETPIMYDYQHPSLYEYLNRFPARQYTLNSDDKEFFLRFSACFGQFLMAHDAIISYKNLPIRLYELTKYSFRREKSGELTGLRRLRAFTMPDCHAICANLEQAKEEFVKRFRLSMSVLESLGLSKDDYELAIRFTRDFYENNKDFIISLISMFGKPALVELWEERFFYFVLKWEFNFIDSLDKASALSTDQIDIENAKRYGITYVDENGEKRHPLILHNSPSGAIERDIYAILEKAYMVQSKGLVPILPLWLSPTQVRIVPVSENFYQYSINLCEQIEAHKIRVDVDDRPLTLNRKIMDAEREWIPYILVVGEKEVQSNILTVRVRGEKEFKKVSLEELLIEIKSKTLDKPFKPLPLPKLLSKRPKFYG
ncbi:MAG: threonine--tRNA ligase [Nitrososphaeria archaeon]|nr:threonine--tRNA ligase [Nitrososphaeria archaeon]